MQRGLRPSQHWSRGLGGGSCLREPCSTGSELLSWHWHWLPPEMFLADTGKGETRQKWTAINKILQPQEAASECPGTQAAGAGVSALAGGSNGGKTPGCSHHLLSLVLKAWTAQANWTHGSLLPYLPGTELVRGGDRVGRGSEARRGRACC